MVQSCVGEIREKVRAVLRRLMAFYEYEGRETEAPLLESEKNTILQAQKHANPSEDAGKEISKKLRKQCMPGKYNKFLKVRDRTYC